MPLNALYGYVGFLLDFLAESGVPRWCAAAFDESLGTCFRNEIYPAYKASRELPDEALAFQLQACREATEHLGIPCFSCDRYEADDYIATLARVCRAHDLAVTVVTRDKDLGQVLAAPDDHWWDFAAGIRLNPETFAEKHGVKPSQFADYLALVGDPVDDIPGIPGVGAKTASALLSKFDSLAQLEAGLDCVAELELRGARGLQARLKEHWPQARLAQKLTQLDYHVPGLDAPPTYQPSRDNIDQLIDYLGSLDLSGPLLRRCRALREDLVA